MLTRPKASNGNEYWAQIGWSKHVSGGWSSIDIFTSWTDANGHFWVDFHNGAATQATYYTYWVPGTKKFTMAADTRNWQTGVTGGWTPTNVQVYGETHNYNTQMPGDTSNKVLMDNARYLLSGESTWRPIDSAAAANKTWYGATKNSSTSYSIWDKACSSDG